LIILLTISGAFAQISSSVLRCVVTNENQDIIPDAKLVLRDESGAKFQTKSDEGGNFSNGELRFGKYSLTVEKEGFAMLSGKLF
jgi:hypothetical protein